VKRQFADIKPAYSLVGHQQISALPGLRYDDLILSTTKYILQLCKANLNFVLARG
jgi:hypothetical protein